MNCGSPRAILSLCTHLPQFVHATDLDLCKAMSQTNFQAPNAIVMTIVTGVDTPVAKKIR